MELERQLADLDASEPKPPLVRLVVMQEPTTPALLDALANRSPNVAVLSDEGGNDAGGHSMKADNRMNTLAIRNKLWDGRSVSSERRTVESLGVESPRTTFGFAMQPAAVTEAAKASNGLDRGIGYMARLIVSNPESTQGTRKFREPGPMPSLARFTARIRELLDIQLPLDGRVLRPTVLTLDAEAKAEWVRFHDEVEEELGPGGDMADARDVAAKAADNAARIAALLHVFERGPIGQIEHRHMKGATDLMTWHLYQFRRYFCELAPTPEMVKAQKLEAWLIRRHKTTGELQTKTQAILNSGPAPLRHRQDLDAALNVLTRASRARKVNQGRTELVEVNPALMEAA